MPKLRAPNFEFVPGGRILCMKCRNICPCATCRRDRGENGEWGNGLNGFYDLTVEAREEVPLKKKNQIGSKATLRKSSHRHPNLADKGPIVGDRGVSHKHRNGPENGADLEEIICLEKSWAELTAGSRASTAKKPPDSNRGPQCPCKQKLCAVEKRSDDERDCTGDETPIKSERRFPKAGATADMASILQKKRENLFDSEDARLERHERRLKLEFRELELSKARAELNQKNATANGLAKAKMIQDFLRCGSTFEEALKATKTCLGPATSHKVTSHSNSCRPE
ncbi:hypothetical protein PtA15_12A505 [Puccinia triticina]|uniref:Zinc-finger domain-containing protein n=1 Tax=Puccinia triticina TaxID=208348 RepID=A0ABY7D3D2_9BASI|nr:uncharacterized protein PtA15_12A505 [Puccinia triticina]WAQ90515.1 hypothetical protein PtA15_12A505 [Puccinia triticina]